ncbi:hypothetical protein DL771_003796 [Monosporascus sp. 5C6A]|nr:hypothetical protein DL771_003796 [Monosporascus sp. 5C6A]
MANCPARAAILARDDAGGKGTDPDAIFVAIEKKIDSKIDAAIKLVDSRVDAAVKALESKINVAINIAKKVPPGTDTEIAALQRRITTIESLIEKAS